MKGKYRIVVENKRIKYDFEIRRNLTIIKGDSATGKTTLIDMIDEFYENGELSGIHFQCDRQCGVLSGANWKILLSAYQNSILFIDEGNAFVRTQEFATEIQKTSNYYVIVTREALPTLPYSITEIYGIRDSGKYGSLKQTYNELYRIYGSNDMQEIIRPELIITEDSGAGFNFWDYVCKKGKSICKSAYGKSNIFKEILAAKEDNVLVIADGAAFGAEMEKVVSLMDMYSGLRMYLPESFEWMILRTGIIKKKELEQILEETYEFVESSEYMSWEQFFTALLIEKTKDTYLAYSKRAINKAYLTEHVQKQIVGQMEHIEL